MSSTSGGAALQLRILSGMHAGARALLQGDEYTLGAQDDCDFVLTDEGVQPRHARLSRCDDGWQLDWVAQEDGEPVLAPVRIEPGKAVPLGPVVVAVDEALAPWPTLEQLVLVPHAPALEPTLPPPMPAEPMRAQGWRDRLRATLARRAVAWAATVSTAAVSALAIVAWPMGLHEGAARRQAEAVDSLSTTVLPDAAQKKSIEAALGKLGLAERATIEPAGVGWRVRAAVMSDVEGESLTAALSRIQPRPALRMTSEQDLRDDVADMLLRLAPEYRGNISLRYLGESRFRLEGRMAKAGERDKLLRALAAAFPHVREWDNGVLAGEEMADKLLAELRSRGNWAITSEPGKGTLEMEVRLQKRDLPQWEQALLSAAGSYAVPFHARLEFLAPTASLSGTQSSLPFEVRGVVGGEMPYVLLQGGEKLAQGGTWHGWRLAAVSATQVVFDNGARRAIVQR